MPNRQEVLAPDDIERAKKMLYAEEDRIRAQRDLISARSNRRMARYFSAMRPVIATVLLTFAFTLGTFVLWFLIAWLSYWASYWWAL